MINLDNILPDTTAEILKGRKPAAIGEIRDFNGKKYRKTPNGWRLVSSRSTDVKTEKIGEKTKFSDEELREDYKKIQEIDSKAEKTVLEELGGGCQWPLGANAHVEGNKLYLYAILLTRQGEVISKVHLRGPISDAQKMGEKAAKIIKEDS